MRTKAVYLKPDGADKLNFRWVIRGLFVWRGRGIGGEWVTCPRREIQCTVKRS